MIQHDYILIHRNRWVFLRDLVYIFFCGHFIFGTLFFLCFQKSNIFVGCGSADVADPCQFTDIQLLALVGGGVAKEGGKDVLFAHLRSVFLYIHDIYVV